MSIQSDFEHCAAAIRTGSYSFHAASRLLPARVRNPALVLYAFCRMADDEVDEGDAKICAVLALQERLDRAYAGAPLDRPEDRAFAHVIEQYEMPRALPEALLEGLAWDADERRYTTLSDLRAYCTRVASAVGAMMCVLMRARDRHALARACDLGVAMQLTNIARDIGEDARAGRLYLPTEWMADPDAFLARPTLDVSVPLCRRLLKEADKMYSRSEAGISVLPPDARMGIWAARLIYDGIGTSLRRLKYNSLDHRARTSQWQKTVWLAQSVVRANLDRVTPQSSRLYAPALPEAQYLVAAAAEGPATDSRSAALMGLLLELRARDYQT